MNFWKVDIESGECNILYRYPKYNSCFSETRIIPLSVAQDGKWFAIICTNDTLKIVNPFIGKNRTLQFDYYPSITKITALSPDAHFLSCEDYKGNYIILNLDSATYQKLDVDSNSIMSAVFSPNGEQFAIATYYDIRIFNLKSKEYKTIEISDDKYLFLLNFNITFSPYGRYIAGVSGGTVRIFNLKSGKYQDMVSINTIITSISFSPNERFLAVGQSSGNLMLWDLEREECIFSNKYSPHKISIDFSQLVQGTIEGLTYARNVYFVDPKNGECYLKEHNVENAKDFSKTVIEVMEYSPNGEQVACALIDGTIRTFHLKSGKSSVIIRDTYGVSDIAYSPDGEKILYGLEDGNLWLSNNMYYSEKNVWIGRLDSDYRLDYVAFSIDGKLVAACSGYNGETEIWNIENGQHQFVKKYSDRIYYPPTNTWRSDDKVSWILNMGEGKSNYINHDFSAYSPDGRQMAIAKGNTLLIKDRTNSRIIRSFLIIPDVNLSGANFELAIVERKDKELLKMAGAIV